MTARALAVEIVIVPHSITRLVAERTNLFLILIGAGAAGDEQCLSTEYVRVQPMHTQTMGRFVTDVHQGNYPPPQFLTAWDTTAVEAVHERLEHTACGAVDLP